MERLLSVSLEDGFNSFVSFLFEVSENAIQGIHAEYDKVFQDYSSRRLRLNFSGDRHLSVIRNEFPGESGSNRRFWRRHCEKMGYPGEFSGIIIRVIFDNKDVLNRVITKLPNAFNRHTVRYEYRDKAELFNNIKIDNSDFVGNAVNPRNGSAGGFLADHNSGDTYVVSCAHVLGKVGDDVYFQTNKIGDVKFREFPDALNSHEKCNAANQCDASDIDLAVAKLSSVDASFHSRINIIHTSRDIQDISPRENVYFIGSRSGYTEAKIGSACLMQEFHLGQKRYCFKNLFEIIPRNHTYLNKKLAEPGDSGSWVISEINGTTSWDGLLIGGLQGHAYCCFAEKIFETLNRNNYGRLSL
ncbi:hypothetical protein [Aliikangiella sp. G2MR2-5]|uniref:hypothetical protein n=1 Tax=Aliikangiella sp. G2MR2-5 TaxID=2788943 RepID=UPI0018AA9515|nr:hypothetical protein [Aliikangiella sp. G2MR2-5]